jgi:excisionase family DNA binding protein
MEEERRMDIRQVKPVTKDELLTLEEAAAFLKVSKSWIYERTRRGAIPHLKLGKYLRFPMADLLLWLAAQGQSSGKAIVSRFNGKE